MIEDINFQFITNVSIDTYEKKTDAIACLSKEGAKAIGKDKMAFMIQTVTIPEFLELATSGHTFCNLFDFDPAQKYWTETSDGKKYLSTPVYSRGANKGGMKLAFKSDKYFLGAQTVFIDVDFTRFQTIPEYIQTLTLPPSCVYMSYSDKLEKKGLTSRRFRMVYVFDRILGRDEFTRISQTITDQIVIDTAEPMDDDCGTRMSQYMNGVYGNPETYQSGCIYSPSDFPEPSQDIEFTITAQQQQSSIPASEFSETFLNDIENQDYATFMHYHSWQYRYFYRTEKPDWIADLYQLTDEHYLQLWYPRQKLVDGENRRRRLFKRACLRRLMVPDVDADTLLFNLYVDLVRFIDNSDLVIQLDTLKRKVVNAMKMTPEQLTAYCAQEINYWHENRPTFICKPGTKTTLGMINEIKKAIRWRDLDARYNKLKSLNENLAVLNDVPVRTLYRYCAENEIDTTPSHITKEEARALKRDEKAKTKKQFRELYNADRSLRENMSSLEEHGLNLSLDTISRWSREIDVKKEVLSFPPISLPSFEDYDVSMSTSDWDMPEVREELEKELSPEVLWQPPTFKWLQ